MATRKKNEWYRTQRSFFDRAKQTTDTLKKNKAKWGVPDEIITEADTFVSEIEALFEKGRFMMNGEEHYRLICYIAEGRRFFLAVVRNWVSGKYALKVISAVEVRELGFNPPGEKRPFHERLGIVTVKAYLTAHIVSVDHVLIHVERADIDIHESKASAWPHGANGIIIGYKLALASANTWQYQFTSILRTDLSMPPEWRGKDVVFKAAYVAHANDDLKQLHFSSEQVVSLPRTADETYNTGNNEQ